MGRTGPDTRSLRQKKKKKKRICTYILKLERIACWGGKGEGEGKKKKKKKEKKKKTRKL